MPVTVLGWKPINKGAVVGVVDIQLGKSLEIYSCLVMRSNGSTWVADRIGGDRFSHAVLNAIAAKFGDAP